MKTKLKPGRIYVADDLGELWYFDHRSARIKMHGDDSLPASERGYYCSNLQHGIRELKRTGYITVKK